MTQDNKKKILTQLREGMTLIYNGNQTYTVDKALVDSFNKGDKLLFTGECDAPLVLPKTSIDIVAKEMALAEKGFYEIQAASDSQINQFYEGFSQHLSNDDIWQKIQQKNEEDVNNAQKKGRSVTRLIANETCRQGMIAGLLDFKKQKITSLEPLHQVKHEGWSVEMLKSPLGVVGFVFEGRPNVIADATGILKSGSSVVFRIGQDALQTSKAILEFALYPALAAAGISSNVIRLIDSPERSTAWALFSNTSLNLAVARGSGFAVRLLGDIAQQHGIPVSLHGTGGAWMVTTESTERQRLIDAIKGSLDRKVCNTLNTLCILKSQVDTLFPDVLTALKEAGETLGQPYKVHVEARSKMYLDKTLFENDIEVHRASGCVKEKQFELIDESLLGQEWEWEKTPEVTVVVVESVEEAIRLFNRYSPQFVISFITEDKVLLSQYFKQVNAPFVGNGMTRWVDGQYALNAPELGLSNWENGRFLARSAILSGDSVYTTRLKMIQQISDLKR